MFEGYRSSFFDSLTTLPKRKLEGFWFSHHIPKTAGTSLRESYQNTFGKRQVFQLYEPSQVLRFERGDFSLLNTRPLIIHGHFKPTEYQVKNGTRVKRTVWLRDPVTRALSLLKHLIQTQNYKQEYKLLEKTFGASVKQLDEEKLYYFLSEPSFKHLNQPYQNYFKHISLNEFDFVGKVENYSEDLERLGNYMGVKLRHFERNVRDIGVTIDTQKFAHLLEKEYEVVKDYYE